MNRRTFLTLLATALFAPTKLAASSYDAPIAPDGSFMHVDHGIGDDHSVIALVKNGTTRNFFIIDLGHGHTEQEAEAFTREFIGKVRAQCPMPAVPFVDEFRVIPTPPLRALGHFIRGLFK